MNVQYRNLGLGLAVNQFATAKGDDEGRVEVVGSISPAPVPPGVETVSESSGFVTSFLLAGAFALTKLYLSLNAPLTGAGPFYVCIFDSSGAPTFPAQALIPSPKMANAGDFFFWEPPGGVQFANGIYITMSTTPFLAAAAGTEPFAVSLWTVP